MGKCSTPVFMCFYLKWSLLMDLLGDIRGILHCLGDGSDTKITLGFGLKSLTLCANDGGTFRNTSSLTLCYLFAFIIFSVLSHSSVIIDIKYIPGLKSEVERTISSMNLYSLLAICFPFES